jgi:ribosome recycling factor
MEPTSVRSKMQQVLTLVSSDIGSIRSGGASPALVGDLQVAVYQGQQKLKIQELATISTPDTQTILIDPWDKSILGEIVKGIQSANIGMNPSVSSQGGAGAGAGSQVIRISLPPLTTEDREKYVKLLSAKLENARVMVRQIRGDFMHDIKKAFEAKELSEDEKFTQEKKLQGITDEFIGKINELGEKKKEELLQI